MTIAISMKVNDGIVLAADSAASIMAEIPGTEEIGVINIHEHADKVFNLEKGSPIGAITWGIGGIGNSSISTLMKDFRKEPNGVPGGEIDIQDVTHRLVDFVYERHYRPAFETWKKKPNIGFMVVGYSRGEDFAEEWLFEIVDGQLVAPRKIRGENESGLTWNGEIEVIARLYLGFGSRIGDALRDIGLEHDLVEKTIGGLRQRLSVPLVVPAMPIQDAIDLAEFLVETTVKFSQYSPGAPTVGGPIDIAAITKHEGFRWVRRKHYFKAELNPT